MCPSPPSSGSTETTERPSAEPLDPAHPFGDIAADVVRRAVAGDDSAFAAIVEHYDPMLRELTVHVLGDGQGMDDVLQATYLKAYRSLPRLTATAPPGPWLYRIAYLTCLDELHRRQRRTARPNRPNHPNGTKDPNRPDLDVEAAEPSAFSRALRGLRADRRAAIVLADRAGLDLTAVAKVLGQSEAAVGLSLTRARARLHTALDADAAEPEPHA